jgi:uncharacterized metal-binding protein
MLVYACSGSSNVAQLANYLAVRLDRLGLAEMSCIVGVGGNVKPLVHKATRGLSIIAIDGCPLGCTEQVLRAKGIEPDVLVRLHERGLRKRQHTDFDTEERERVVRRAAGRARTPPRGRAAGAGWRHPRAAGRHRGAGRRPRMRTQRVIQGGMGTRSAAAHRRRRRAA